MPETLKRFDANARGRDFFVGDLHGCYQLFFRELDSAGFDPSMDRVFSVGDLVDRGPDSARCLELVEQPWFHAVAGNHEAMMADALDGEDPTLWIMNGGDWFFRDDADDWRGRARELLRQLPLAMEVPVAGRRIGVIHADVTSGHWGEFREDQDIWSRNRIAVGGTGPVAEIDLVVVGHSILGEVSVVDNVVHIDTGAFATGRLQLLEGGDLTTMCP